MARGRRGDAGTARVVGEQEFLELCEGKHPTSGDRLTQRLNSVRLVDGKPTSNRRIFHDFTISPPKSVSIVALCLDERIRAVHREAVRYAMTELESFAETRVRIGGQDSERVTANTVTACFEHDTSRALDPHLHTHCVVFNATYDPIEKRWKALQTAGMYRAQKFAENLYFHELAKGLRRLGYRIENNARNFEVAGVSPTLIQRFSKRHEQIDAEARQYVAHGYDGDLGALRTRLAHEHRERKIKTATAEQLREHWWEEMTAGERDALELVQIGPTEREAVDLRAVVAWAHEHLFERRAVVNDYELLAAALLRGRGGDFDLAELRTALAARDYIRTDGSRKLIARELLQYELDLVLAARERRHEALNAAYCPDAHLSAEQQRAARQILRSRQFITVFRGGAGTGKSHTLKEIGIGLAGAKRPVVVLAPQRQQVDALATDGLPAETLAHALTTGEIAHGAAVILDEAGQVGGKDLWHLVQLVRAAEGRLILSGDTRQHGAVAASDALRAIERYGHGRIATLRTIHRQNPALARSAEERRLIRGYRAAVKLAADGKQGESFDRLERMGCIVELPDEARLAALAGEYVMALQRGERPLVVAQTWAEVHAANDAVRQALHGAGRIGDGVAIKIFQPVDRSEAQKRDARFYQPGQAVHFLRSYGRFAKGETCEVLAATDHGIVLSKKGRRSIVGYRHADRFVVANPMQLEIAPGDRLQIKANGLSVEGERLHNGELVTVSRIDLRGTLVVADDRGRMKTLSADQRLLVPGYAVTSYGSQGKTADVVLFADAGNAAATDARQWYVTISRGRKRVVIFTPDKDELRSSIENPHERELAIDEERISEAIRLAQRERQHRRESVRQTQATRVAMPL
jgi:conjugative relaxase-like TrwC/TraI family protein